jgi:hypothetical protein
VRKSSIAVVRSAAPIVLAGAVALASATYGAGGPTPMPPTAVPVSSPSAVVTLDRDLVFDPASAEVHDRGQTTFVQHLRTY